MKKIYTAPQTEKRVMEYEGMICGTIFNNETGINTNLTGGSTDNGDFGDENTINAKPAFVWDEYISDWPLNVSDLELAIEEYPSFGEL